MRVENKKGFKKKKKKIENPGNFIIIYRNSIQYNIRFSTKLFNKRESYITTYNTRKIEKYTCEMVGTTPGVTNKFLFFYYLELVSTFESCEKLTLHTGSVFFVFLGTYAD